MLFLLRIRANNLQMGAKWLELAPNLRFKRQKQGQNRTYSKKYGEVLTAGCSAAGRERTDLPGQAYLVPSRFNVEERPTCDRSFFIPPADSGYPPRHL